MTNLVGSDLDGILTVNQLNRADYRPFKMHEYYAQCVSAPLCRTNLDVIITGRRIHYKKVTKKWLAANGVKYDKLVMFPNKIRKNNRSLAEYKAKVINALGIGVFYEDDEKIVKYLQMMCQNALIVQVPTVL